MHITAIKLNKFTLENNPILTNILKIYKLKHY